MKKLIAIVIFCGVLLQTFSMVVIITSFYANQDYIAQNLCQNRDKPSMHCNGKCYLKKKLAQDNKEQAPNHRNTKSEQVINLICSKIDYEIKKCYPIINIPVYSPYNVLYTHSFQSSVFHPPTNLCM